MINAGVNKGCPQLFPCRECKLRVSSGNSDFRDYVIELDLRLPEEALDAEYLTPEKKNIRSLRI
jgi:hypothetical protein